jgi:hypothetical protein
MSNYKKGSSRVTTAASAWLIFGPKFPVTINWVKRAWQQTSPSRVRGTVQPCLRLTGLDKKLHCSVIFQKPDKFSYSFIFYLPLVLQVN